MKEKSVQFLDNLLGSSADFISKLVTILAIILLGLLLAFIARKLVRKLIYYLDIQLNSVLQQKDLNVDLKGSAKFTAGTVFWLIVAVFVLLAIHLLNLQVLQELFDRLIIYLPNILAAVVVIFLGGMIGKLAGDLLKNAVPGKGRGNKNIISLAVRYFILFVAIVIAADQLGVHIKFLTDVIDIILGCLLLGAALAFALGAQTSVSNILGSYYVKQDHQVGSKVKIGNITGTITKISDHAIHLDTDDGKMIIPAKKFNESEVTIINLNHEE